MNGKKLFDQVSVVLVEESPPVIVELVLCGQDYFARTRWRQYAQEECGGDGRYLSMRMSHSQCQKESLN